MLHTPCEFLLMIFISSSLYLWMWGSTSELVLQLITNPSVHNHFCYTKVCANVEIPNNCTQHTLLSFYYHRIWISECLYAVEELCSDTHDQLLEVREALLWLLWAIHSSNTVFFLPYIVLHCSLTIQWVNSILHIHCHNILLGIGICQCLYVPLPEPPWLIN